MVYSNPQPVKLEDGRDTVCFKNLKQSLHNPSFFSQFSHDIPKFDIFLRQWQILLLQKARILKIPYGQEF